jgi:hypothetical protein
MDVDVECLIHYLDHKFYTFVGILKANIGISFQGHQLMQMRQFKPNVAY